MRDRCRIHNEVESNAVAWTLHSAVEDARTHVSQLADGELTYCLERESRLTVIKMLQREAKKRDKARGAKA